MTYTHSKQIVISGTGIWVPEYTITNEELVSSYNLYAEKFNIMHMLEIAAGTMEEKPLSSEKFIEKASGIKSRYAYTKKGILDIDRLCPDIQERKEEELSNQAEIAIHAAQKAMAAAGKTPEDIDAVIVSCTYTQRAYPAIAIEVQQNLGIQGFGFDMLMACSAATFGLNRAYDCLSAGSARCVLIINPEILTPQVNYRDRQSHFIFGDVSTAVIMETAETCTSNNRVDILSTRSMTRYSSSIRSNFGYLSQAANVDPFGPDKLFHQAGKRVFEELSGMTVSHIKDHLAYHDIEPEAVALFFLHQANINMNRMVIKQLFQKDVLQEKAPIVLDQFANTASAGSIIAFHLHHQKLTSGDIGMICSFGAGYSAGSLILRKP
ncbi:MAG: beta-ketoacyl-ACP synthase III [Proteobacteria bacterium]|nr:beta-ketoacyl-ACP synthase III [Pseudomonadota bacterium]